MKCDEMLTYSDDDDDDDDDISKMPTEIESADEYEEEEVAFPFIRNLGYGNGQWRTAVAVFKPYRIRKTSEIRKRKHTRGVRVVSFEGTDKQAPVRTRRGQPVVKRLHM